MKKFIKKLWRDRHDYISVLAYLLVVGWFGYVLYFIKESDLLLFPKILLLVGGSILAFLNCIGLSKAFSEDDKD